MVRFSIAFIALFVGLSLVSFVQVPTASAAANGFVRDGSFNMPASTRNGTVTPYAYTEENARGYGATNEDLTQYGDLRDGSFNMPGSVRGSVDVSSFTVTKVEQPRGYGAMNGGATHGYGMIRDGSFNRPVSHR